MTTLGGLGLLLAAFIAYVAFTPRAKLELHLFLGWAFIILTAVVSLPGAIL